MRSSVVFALLLLLTSGLLAEPDLAFAQSSDAVQKLSADLHSAQRTHLWRVAAWGGANVLGGLALVGGSSRSGPTAARWNFGAMSAGWGAVNVGIAAQLSRRRSAYVSFQTRTRRPLSALSTAA
ncbi:MAG: hypothetical protein R6T83_01590, partial [Salinibacter sp.]